MMHHYLSNTQKFYTIKGMGVLRRWQSHLASVKQCMRWNQWRTSTVHVSYNSDQHKDCSAAQQQRNRHDSNKIIDYLDDSKNLFEVKFVTLHSLDIGTVAYKSAVSTKSHRPIRHCPLILQNLWWFVQNHQTDCLIIWKTFHQYLKWNVWFFFSKCPMIQSKSSDILSDESQKLFMNTEIRECWHAAQLGQKIHDKMTDHKVSNFVTKESYHAVALVSKYPVKVTSDTESVEPLLLFQ